MNSAVIVVTSADLKNAFAVYTVMVKMNLNREECRYNFFEGRNDYIYRIKSFSTG